MKKSTLAATFRAELMDITGEIPIHSYLNVIHYADKPVLEGPLSMSNEHANVFSPN